MKKIIAAIVALFLPAFTQAQMLQAITTQSAHGYVLQQNLGTSAHSVLYLNRYFVFGCSFTTSGAYTLTQVGFTQDVVAGSGVWTHAVTIQVYADTGSNAPNLVTGLIGSSIAYQPTLTGSYTTPLWQFASGIDLAGSTRYWFLFSSITDPVNYAQNSIQLGTGESCGYVDGGTWNNVASGYQFAGVTYSGRP